MKIMPSPVVKMQQLNLNIVPRLAYDPDNFLIHRGVKESLHTLNNMIKQDSFGLAYLHGAKRSGKTHFCIYLANCFLDNGLNVQLIEGADFAGTAFTDSDLLNSDANSLWIVDNIDNYLIDLDAGESGTFVSFIENLRIQGAKVILTSALAINDFNCDEHVLSRIRSALQPEMGKPYEEELGELILIMARQRGIHLSARKVEFLKRRVARDIPAIEDYLDRICHLSNVLGKPVRFPLLNDAL